jgi:hypothetical protein
MFILYGVLAGVVGGFVGGGRLERLATIQFRFSRLVVAALLFQLALFSPLGDRLDPTVARFAYVASTAVVGVVVLANIRLPGLALVAVGAGLNLAAILANGGSMPASQAALATAGIGIGGHTNSIVVEHPALEPLTDVFALPAWLPLANVFSVGDVLIGVGIAVVIAAGMRRTASPASIPRAATKLRDRA